METIIRFRLRFRQVILIFNLHNPAQPSPKAVHDNTYRIFNARTQSLCLRVVHIA